MYLCIYIRTFVHIMHISSAYDLMSNVPSIDVSYCNYSRYDNCLNICIHILYMYVIKQGTYAK